MSYNVKPLKWHREIVIPDGCYIDTPTFSAKTIHDDEYHIYGSDEEGYTAVLIDYGDELGDYSALEEVQRACQQHHEKRIKDLIGDFIYSDNEVANEKQQ